MSDTITVQISEEELLNALRRLPPARRQLLLRQLADERRPIVVTLPAAALDRLTGLMAVGGDALEESEQLYDD
jgi:hypothetical protein